MFTSSPNTKNILRQKLNWISLISGWSMDRNYAKLNITLVDNSLSVGQTDVGKVNDFLTVPLVNWWLVRVQHSITRIGNMWDIEPRLVQA